MSYDRDARYVLQEEISVPRLSYLNIIYFLVFKALASGKIALTHHMPQGSYVILQIVTGFSG